MSFWKTYFIIFLITLTGFNAIAAPRYDSLEIRNSLDRASKLLSDAKYKDALNLFDTLRASAHKASEWEDYIEAGRGFAICNFNLGNYDLALNDRKVLMEIASTRLKNKPATIAILHNDLGQSFSNSGNYQKAVDQAKKALAIQLKHHGESHKNTTQTLNDLGLIFSKQSEMDSAMKYYQWSLDIRKKMFPENDPSLASSLSNIGTLYARLGDYDKQAEYYEDALKIFLANYGEEHPNVATLYNNLAYAHRKNQDYDKQIRYLEKSLSLRLKIFGEKHPAVAESYHNIAGHYILQNDFEKCREFAEKSQKLYKAAYGETHIKIASSYHMMGVAYERNQQFAEALEYYQKSVEIYIAKFHDEHPTLAIRYNNMAACYAGLKQWNKQKEFLEKALNIRIKVYGSKHSRVGSIHNNLGKHYLNVGHFEKAMEQFQFALVSTSDIFGTLSDSISRSGLSIANSKDLLIKVLKNKAATSDSLYFQTKKTELLSDALNDLNMAIRIADLLRFEISADYSRQKVTKETMPTYESAIRISLKLHEITKKKIYLEQALKLSEQSKIFQLRLTLQDAKAKQFANIPDSLLNLETNLKRNIVYLEKTLDRAKQKKDSSKIAQLKDKLWNHNNDFSKLIAFLEEKYPDYYALKFNQEIATIESIRKNVLDPESILIEYFFGERTLYTFRITQTDLEVFEAPINSTFNEATANYIKSTSDYDFILSDKVKSDQLYTESSSQLYDLVLKKQLGEQNKDLANLIIVPDGILNLLNFDALLTQKTSAINPDYKTLPYLINDFGISYAYSTSFLQNNFENNGNGENKFVGFAPQVAISDFDISNVSNTESNSQLVRNDISKLPATKEEIEQINQLMNGDIWVGSNATEEIFKQKSKDYNILHLATHGQLDDQNPLNSELLFAPESDSINDGSLSVSEIYNLNLNAQLAVLSACNTGQGKILKGEGVKSLSQAFSYAGCPSVIMSLWRVPDTQTRDLMVELYAGLNQGLPKDAALRTAKLNYLKNTQDPLYYHPFYWSSFALMGKKSPLKYHSNFEKWVIFPLLILISVSAISKIGWMLFQSIEHVK